jgi:hypothetical protein
MAAQDSLCGHWMHEQLMSDKSVVYWPKEYESPHLLPTAANQYHTEWYRAHIGDHIRTLTHWLFK